MNLIISSGYKFFIHHKMKNSKILVIAFCFISIVTFGQNENISDTIKNSNNIDQKFRELKDSLSRYRQLIPAVSSIVVNKGEIELIIYSSLAYASSFRNDLGERDDLPFVQSYFQNGIQATYGVIKDRFNLGFDINTGLVDIDNNATKFPSSLFRKKEYPDLSTGLILTSIGPRVRWRPFRKNYNFVLQASTLFPTYGNSDYKYLFGTDQIFANAQLFYNLPITKNLFLFSQFGVQYGIKNNQSSEIFVFPISIFLSYLVTPKTILFSFGNFVQIRSNESIFKNSGTTQIGFGTQHQFSKKYVINAYYAKEVSGKNFYTYDNVSLSIRILIN